MIVLVVEDNDIFRKLVVENLRDFPSLEVYEAATAEEALQEFQTCSPDLVFMDLDLGGENGFSVIRKIRGLRPQVALALLTSFDLPEYKQAALQYQVDYFLTKGISTQDDILGVVNSFRTRRGREGRLPI